MDPAIWLITVNINHCNGYPGPNIYLNVDGWKFACVEPTADISANPLEWWKLNGWKSVSSSDQIDTEVPRNAGHVRPIGEGVFKDRRNCKQT